MTIDDIVRIAGLAGKDKPLGVPHLDKLFNEADTAVYYRFIYHLIQFMQPGLAVELGVLFGRATAHMAAAKFGTLVLAFDPNPKPEAYEVAKKYQNIRLLNMASTFEAATGLVGDNSVDLLFIDTVHEYDQVLFEVGTWLPKMKKGGVILFDDISLDDGMIRAWAEIQKMFPKNVSLPSLHHSGFGAVVV